MAEIRDLEGFTADLERCFLDPTSYDRNRMNSYLCDLSPDMPSDRHGLSMHYTMDLAVKLLTRAFNDLTDGATASEFSQRIARSMAEFTTPFSEKLVGCYPHFLLHGISTGSIDKTISKIHDNARMIHETLAERDSFIERRGRTDLGDGLGLAYHKSDIADHCFGIAAMLVDPSRPYGTYSGYIAKFGFFLDKTCLEAIGLGVQGQKPMKKGEGRYFARLSHHLKMDPRSYLVRKVMGTLSDEGYTRLKVLVPSENPMAIENHHGFLGRYDSALLEAGLTNKEGIYLTAALRS